MSIPVYELNDGSTVPVIGFGTYPLRGEEGTAAITSALEVGYRLIDSAVNYENEECVGEAFRRSGLDREDVIIGTKIPGRFQAFDETIASIELSLRKMRLDYVDYALIHWPNPSVGLYREAWRGLVEARDRDLVRIIGVSNFTKRFLVEIIDDSGVIPSINQVELHPAFAQDQLLAVDRHLDVQTMSWSPLGRAGSALRSAPVVAAAQEHDVSPAQVILRWHLQIGALPVPKAASREHQEENLGIFSFELTEAQMDAITGLSRPDGRLFDGDPNTHEEM